MIIAREARSNVAKFRDAQNSIKLYVEIIDSCIDEYSKKGLTEFWSSEDTRLINIQDAHPEFPLHVITPLIEHILNYYKNMGYKATYEKKSQFGYVPRGLQDDDGNGKIYYNWEVKISWE